MSPDIIDLDEFIVVGIRAVLETRAHSTATMWRERFLPRRGEISGIDSKYYCVFNILPDGKLDGRFESVAGVVGTLEDIPEGMVGWIIPGGRYARIQCSGLPEIATSCRHVLTDWLLDSEYKWTGGPVFAKTADAQPDSPDATWEIHVPVETPDEIEQLKKWSVGAEA